ncbi:MAG: hypothetical protein ACSHX5_00070 [Phycisphaerales bacterium]
MDIQEATQFEDHCRDAVLELRGALLDLFQEVGSDPTRPQDVARRFKLNKNLTWKIAKIVGSESAFDAVEQVPGTGGMKIVLESMRQADASEEAIARVKGAMDRYEQMIQIHVGDRVSLELMLDGMGSDKSKLLKSRKLVYQGNTGLWGLQANARITAQFIAPSTLDPMKLDIAQVTGLQRVRRLRQIDRWDLFRFVRLHGEGQEQTRLPIDLAEQGCPGLMSEFSEGVLPEIRIEESERSINIELGPGPVGKTGEFSSYFGYMYPGCESRYASADDDEAFLFSSISMPAQVLLFDLYVHKDLYPLIEPRVNVFGNPWSSERVFDEKARIEVLESFQDLGRGANISTALARNYPRVIETTLNAGGWQASDFHCLRLLVDYPPMGSAIGVTFKLPSEP